MQSFISKLKKTLSLFNILNSLNTPSGILHLLPELRVQYFSVSTEYEDCMNVIPVWIMKR